MNAKNIDAETVKFLEDKSYKIRYDLLNFIYRIEGRSQQFHSFHGQ